MDQLLLVKSTVKKAGDELLKYYNNNQNKNTIHEDGYTPLTKADLESEKILINELGKSSYPVLSEHTDNKQRLNQDKVWIIDPIDGTKDFLQRTGEFSIMAGLVYKGRPILGVVYQPTTDKLYYAEKDKGAFLENKGHQLEKLQVSNKKDISSFTMLVSRNHLLPTDTAFIKKAGITNTIPYGSAGLKTGLIAENKADLYINTSNKTGEWDICAADIIIHEAGGKMTDMNGEMITYNKKDARNSFGFIVSNGQTHEDIIRIIKNK